MPALLPFPVRQVMNASLIALTLVFAVPALADAPASAGRSTLTIVERSIAQEQGSWLVEYRLRHDGPTGVIVTPTDILLKVDAWLSNSRVASHAMPRVSSLVVSGASGLAAVADVIPSSDEAQRCRERIIVQVWTEDCAEPSAAVGGHSVTERPPILSIAPGAMVRVRIRLEHMHVLYGDYDPLLGQRQFELRLGLATLRNTIPMDREQYLAMPKATWPAPPDERRDTRHFVSAPDSLHLEAHVPGNQYYRFPERPVRYGTLMRLRFWYLIASGTDGECRARVAQYKDTPTAWKVLSEGAHEECLTTVGRWVKVERVFRTESEATTLALDFRVSSPVDVGEMWIDDVSLEPIAAGPSGP